MTSFQAFSVAFALRTCCTKVMRHYSVPSPQTPHFHYSHTWRKLPLWETLQWSHLWFSLCPSFILCLLPGYGKQGLTHTMTLVPPRKPAWRMSGLTLRLGYGNQTQNECVCACIPKTITGWYFFHLLPGARAWLCSRGQAMSWCLSVWLEKGRVANKHLQTWYSMNIHCRDISVSDTSQGGSFCWSTSHCWFLGFNLFEITHGSLAWLFFVDICHGA